MRRLSDLQIMVIVLRNWHRPQPDRRLPPAAHETAAFLWLLLLLALLMIGGFGIAAWLGHAEEHRDHRARTAGLVERVHGLELQAARQEENEAHAADGAGHAGGSA